MPAVLRALLLLLLAVESTTCFSQDAAPLSSLRELHSIGQDVARQHGPVRITGVLTHIDPDGNTLFIQDADWFTSVEIDSETSLPDEISSGDQIAITGSVRAGRVSATIHADTVRRLGSSTLPEPVLAEKANDFEAHNWNRLVQFDATIYQTHAEEGRANLQVSTPGFAAYVIVQFPDETPGVWRWRGRPVRVRGVISPPGPDYSGPPRIVASATQVELLVPEAQIDAEKPFAQIDSLRWSNGEPSSSSQFVGQAISDSSTGELILRDWSGAVRITADNLPEIHVGDVVTVRGKTTGQSQDLLTVSGDIQRIGPGRSIDPVKVNAENASDHAFEVVSVKGMFRGLSPLEELRRPVLKEGDTHFTVSGLDSTLAAFRDLPPDSLVRVTGLCRPMSDQPFAFDVLSHQVDVIYESTVPQHQRLEDSASVPAPPPGPRVELPPPPGPDPIGPLIVTGVSLFMMLVMLVGFLVLLHRSREQRKFYATIHEQLNEVSHVSRLNTLAEMVGALAHELNQPLASVTNFAETARILGERSETVPPQMQEILERIAAESLRAGEIIRRLRTLVQKKTPGHIRTSINQVVQDSLAMFRMRELVTNGTLDVQFSDDLPDIKVDPVQLEQVILNFLLNARDATKQQEDQLPKIVVTTARDGEHVVVSVEDNGPGIASSDPAAVFEPYFTTKSEGMGLGLAICRTIVESHNGSIVAENVEPHGAKLTVRLPVAESVTSAPAA